MKLNVAFVSCNGHVTSHDKHLLLSTTQSNETMLLNALPHFFFFFYGVTRSHFICFFIFLQSCKSPPVEGKPHYHQRFLSHVPPAATNALGLVSYPHKHIHTIVKENTTHLNQRDTTTGHLVEYTEQHHTCVEESYYIHLSVVCK